MNSTENIECGLIGNTPNKNDKNPEKDTGKISGIYKIINNIDGKYYVGSSVNIPLRWRKHKEALCKNRHRNRYLQRAWNKYGSDAFDLTISEYISPERLNDTEQLYLDTGRQTPDKIYNLSFLADRIEMTENVKEVLRRMAKNRFRDKQNHPFYGRKHKSETIDKIKNTLRGKFCGMKNTNVDPKTYTFYNRNLGLTFVGTRYDFCQKYNIHSSRVSAVINGINNLKHVGGWSIKLF